jgi:hypothetical protein
MLNFLKPRKASGFTARDDKVSRQYLVLWNDGDHIGADALLAHCGWTVERLNEVLDHFQPEKTPRVYTTVEIAAARAALALHQVGQEREADKLLKKNKMSADDVTPAVEQYHASLGLDEEDAAEADQAEDAEPAADDKNPAGNVERMVIPVPEGYGDSIEQRAKLVAALWRKLGNGWQVESFDQAESTITAVRGELPSMRPGAEVYGAGPNATTGNGEAIAAGHAVYGRTMLGYDPYTKQVETAVLPPATIELRTRLLRKNPRQKSWELELLPIFGVRDGAGYLAKVIVTRADQSSPDTAKEHAYWTGLAKNTIGHSGWWVQIDDAVGTIEMNAGTPISIPSRVSYDYDVIENGEWGELVVGRDGYNKPVIVDLAATPHALVVGRTGAGKSIFLQTMIFSALAHGFELCILDPTKRGLDFRWARPYVRDGGWGCQTYPEALEALKNVYAEAQRRLDILDELSVPKWSALSVDDQERLGIKPILVVVDEGTSMSKLLALPKSMDKDDPEYVVMADENAAKERILMFVGKILRECRFVGIHLIFGTQRFGVAEIGQGAGEMRENMGARIVLGRSSTTSLSMACADPQDAAAAYEQAHGFAAGDTDPSNTEREAVPGRGLAEIDGRGHVALQGAYAPVDELIARLEQLGVPSHRGDRRPTVPEKEPAFGVVEQKPAFHKPAETAVVDLGEIELNLSDFDLDDDSIPAAPPVEPELDWDDDTAAATPTSEPEMERDNEPEFAPVAAQGAEDDDPFAGEAKPATRPVPEDDDPFAGPATTKPKKPLDDFEW